MKKILVLQIFNKINKKKLSRILKFLEYNFDGKCNYEICKDIDSYKQSNYEIIVFLKKANQNIPNSKLLLSTKKYSIDMDKNRIELKSENKNLLYKFHKTHIFNELQSNFNKGFFYFPYGFTYRMTGLGELDDFGFRIKEDLIKLSKRKIKHKVVCIFGGSAVWSIECLMNEMFTQRLEDFLNNDKELKTKGLKFTCLNFGQSAATIFQSMNYYLLFASQVRPDFVICHDGWNDMLYGSYTDQYLIKEKKMTYSYELEEWALRVNGLSDEKYKKEEITPFRIKSLPIDIISAYTFRKNQFKKIVEKDKGVFINGIQPTLTDKKKLSEYESIALDKNLINSVDNWRIVRKNMSSMFEKLLESYDLDKSLVNFKKIFSKLSSNSTHFIDNIHLTPLGDDVVAKAYKDIIKSKAQR